jgi:DNA helicase-2/ATP-dependent DNA helicase PcrA
MDILETCSIGDVIDRFDQYNICKIDDRVNAYIQKYPYTYTRVRNVNYKEFMRLYDFENQLQPFTTQHKVKGLEFDNVLVILDNGKWSKYNFNSLFARTNAKESVSLRTRKLFYVCCTRAKENLVVYMPNAKEDVIEGAKSLFGDNQVFEV